MAANTPGLDRQRRVFLHKDAGLARGGYYVVAFLQSQGFELLGTQVGFEEVFSTGGFTTMEFEFQQGNGADHDGAHQLGSNALVRLASGVARNVQVLFLLSSLRTKNAYAKRDALFAAMPGGVIVPGIYARLFGLVVIGFAGQITCFFKAFVGVAEDLSNVRSYAWLRK